MTDNLIPENFIYKLFDQVKESSKKNSEDIVNLTEQTSKMADVIRDLLNNEMPVLKKNCEKSMVSLNEIDKFLEKYESALIKMNDFELEKFRKDQEEKLKILRWLALKFKIMIAVIAAFFILTGGSYVVIKYFTYNDHTDLVSIIKKENEKLREEIKRDNEKFKKEIKEENIILKMEILKKIKKIHPDITID